MKSILNTFSDGFYIPFTNHLQSLTTQWSSSALKFTLSKFEFYTVKFYLYKKSIKPVTRALITILVEANESE